MKSLFKLAFLLIMFATVFYSCKKENQSEASSNPKVNPLDSSRGAAGAIVTLTGSGLGAIKSIVFDNKNVPASFNPVFNNNNAIVFRVPDTAFGGLQNIVLTNTMDVKITVPYTVIALPTVTSVSDYNFTAGTTVTLTGSNLDGVTSVTLAGSTEKATVVSSTRKQLVVTMPAAATVNRAQLIITNATGPITTSQEFVNIDNAYKLFTDNYGAGFQDASWTAAKISTTIYKTGSASFAGSYPKGNWTQEGFGYTNINKTDGYKFLSFWIKGGSVDYPLYIWTSASENGAGTFSDYNKILVPANVWTYFKIPVESLKLWATSSSFNQIGWRIQGPDAQDETFYLDDVIFVK